jgi:hypothetical protein
MYSNRVTSETVTVRNGRFNSETATWVQKRFKKSVGNLESSRHCGALKAETTGVDDGHAEICVKHLGGRNLIYDKPLV